MISIGWIFCFNIFFSCVEFFDWPATCIVTFFSFDRNDPVCTVDRVPSARLPSLYLILVLNFFVIFIFFFLISFRFRPLFFFFVSLRCYCPSTPLFPPSIGSSLLVASPDVAEFERLRSRLNESQTQTRYLQSMVNIRDQELDRARKVSCHVSFGSSSLFSCFSTQSGTKQNSIEAKSARPSQKKNVIFTIIHLSTLQMISVNQVSSIPETNGMLNFFFTCLGKKKGFKSPAKSRNVKCR